MNLYNQLTKGKNNARETEDETEVFGLSYRPNPGGVFNYYLFGPILSPKQFVAALEVLKDASEDDEFVINIQTPGGSIEATDTLLQAIVNTKAHVHVNATGDVCSAGTAIMLAGDSYTISDNARFLIHNGSAGSGGKTSDYKAWALSDIEFMEKFMKNTYKHFFTDEELDQLVNGKDFWLNPEDFIARSEQRNAIMQQEMEKIQQDAVDNFVKNLVDAQEEKAVVKKPRAPRKKAVKTVDDENN
jgi:ATP-dependent protease ClpP protease subunit